MQKPSSACNTSPVRLRRRYTFPWGQGSEVGHENREPPPHLRPLLTLSSNHIKKNYSAFCLFVCFFNLNGKNKGHSGGPGQPQRALMHPSLPDRLIATEPAIQTPVASPWHFASEVPALGQNSARLKPPPHSAGRKAGTRGVSSRTAPCAGKEKFAQ